GVAVSADTGQLKDGTLVPKVLVASSEFKLFRSNDGGQNWAKFTSGMGGDQLPFFVRVARDTAAADGQTFVTFTGTPAKVYLSAAGGAWGNASGALHWQDSGITTASFAAPTPAGQPIGLRNLATHPGHSGVYGAVSSKYAYMTADGG